MAIPAVLLRQLRALDAPVREQLGRSLRDAADDECFADIDAGRTVPYEAAMAQLRAVTALTATS